MISMSKEFTALEREPRRIVRSFVISVFLAGLALGMGVGEIRFDNFRIVWAEMQVPANRCLGVCVWLFTAVLMAIAARDYWRKIRTFTAA